MERSASAVPVAVVQLALKSRKQVCISWLKVELFVYAKLKNLHDERLVRRSVLYTYTIVIDGGGEGLIKVIKTYWMSFFCRFDVSEGVWGDAHEIQSGKI